MTNVPLAGEGLVNAVQTVVEAKTQALANARVSAVNIKGFATGTATDSLCVACLPGESIPYCGPATPHGQELAQAVHNAVFEGAIASREDGEYGSSMAEETNREECGP